MRRSGGQIDLIRWRSEARRLAQNICSRRFVSILNLHVVKSVYLQEVSGDGLDKIITGVLGVSGDHQNLVSGPEHLVQTFVLVEQR